MNISVKKPDGHLLLYISPFQCITKFFKGNHLITILICFYYCTLSNARQLLLTEKSDIIQTANTCTQIILQKVVLLLFVSYLMLAPTIM
jgi:hypothetical protein